MVNVCEHLFKKDIDRSEKTLKRTRRAIIFDRWVIQSQDDPSINQVFDWCKKANLKIYSAYPYVNTSFFGNSFLHLNQCDPYDFTNLFAIPELTWMMQTKEDQEVLKDFDEIMQITNNKLQNLSSLMANFNKNSKLDSKIFNETSLELLNSFENIDLISPLKSKLSIFINEANKFIKYVEKGNLEDLKNCIDNFKVLFTGATGVRHVDFIAYKNFD